MLEEIKEASFLNALRKDLKMYMDKRDNFASNLNQAIGAIYATEQAIAKLFSNEKPEDSVVVAIPEA